MLNPANYGDAILLWTIMNNSYSVWACATMLKAVETMF